MNDLPPLGGGEFQQRRGWLYEDNEVISSAWKCLLLWQISMLGGAFEQEGARKKKGGGRGGGRKVFKRFKSHISKYAPAVRSKIWSKLIFASLCVILRSRVLRIYVGACYTCGARRSCGWWGRRGRWVGWVGENLHSQTLERS